MKPVFTKFLISLFLFSTLLTWVSCKPNDTKILKNAQAKVAAIDSTITVEVKDGVITLSGQVTDDVARMDVETAAKEVKGVRSVVNNVVATPPPPAPMPVTANDDATIAAAINAGLETKGIKGVTVTVMNGEATLTGDASRSDLETIMQIANESKPINVVNNLSLK